MMSGVRIIICTHIATIMVSHHTLGCRAGFIRISVQYVRSITRTCARISARGIIGGRIYMCSCDVLNIIYIHRCCLAFALSLAASPIVVFVSVLVLSLTMLALSVFVSCA